MPTWAMPFRTAMTLILIGFALATAAIVATEAPAGPLTHAPIKYHDLLP